MKPKETVPLLSMLAASAPIVPPVAIIGLAVGVALIWLASDEKKNTAEPEKPCPDGKSLSETAPSQPNLQNTTICGRRVTREDVAEALAYGAKMFSRKEAVESLKSLGFQRSSAYKALSPDGRFAHLMEFTPDGLVEWKG